MEKSVNDYLISILLSLILTIIALKIASVSGFFTSPSGDGILEGRRRTVTWIDVALGFLIFLTVQLFLIPVLILSWYSLKAGKIVTFIDGITPALQGSANLFGMVATFIALMTFNRFLRKDKRQAIWNRRMQKPDKLLKSFFIGIATWFVGYPVSMLIAQIAAFIIFIFYQGTVHDQLAVHQLKMLKNDPLLFGLSVAGIITVVPIVEEFLFRGLLQTWLTSLIGIWKGVLLTAVIFSFFHFSPKQELQNIELILSLFIFSCFLGYVYIRQGTLLASIGLHATFNLMSILMLILDTTF